MSAPLRAATPDDLDLLVELMAEFYAESRQPLDLDAARAAFAQLLADPALGRVWLVQHDGAEVGYVALCFGFSLEFLGRDAFVDDFFVRPAHRGRGLGSAALAGVEAAARALGVRALHLEVGRTNAVGLAVYRKAGFAGHADRQLMTKVLDGAHAREADG